MSAPHKDRRKPGNRRKVARIPLSSRRGRKPRWHANPKTVADVIESLESLGYEVTNKRDVPPHAKVR